MGRVFFTIGTLYDDPIPPEKRCEKCHENRRKWRVDFELTSKRYEICDKCKEVVDRWLDKIKEDEKDNERFISLPNIYPIPTSLSCLSCGLPYEKFDLDVNIPDDQWELLTGRTDGGGFMCATCMIKEVVANHPKFTWAYMEFKE